MPKSSKIMVLGGLGDSKIITGLYDPEQVIGPKNKSSLRLKTLILLIFEGPEAENLECDHVQGCEFTGLYDPDWELREVIYLCTEPRRPARKSGESKAPEANLKTERFLFEISPFW